MAKHYFNSDSQMTWYATASGDSWIVSKGTDFQASNDGISDNGSLHDNRFEIAGHITTQGGEGLDLYGYDATVFAAASAVIRSGSSFGIAFESTAYGGRVENHGTITGYNSGISITGASPASGHARKAEIVNYGDISGGLQNGISSGSADLTIVNKRGGAIDGGQYGYGITSVDHDVTIINGGTIKGNVQGAVGLGTGDDRIVNAGRIVGNVLLGNGNDTYVDKGGSVTGIINGGVGADTYIVHHKGLALHEDDFSDIDTVKTTVNWTLGDNFERLVLAGGQKLHGTGNDAADTIIGNGRKNVLDGLGGDDVLKGGAGGDRFVFASGSGHDTITDFGHGADRIDLSGYAGIHHFGDLDISRQGNDTLITLSAMDTITLKDIIPHDLSGADFLF